MNDQHPRDWQDHKPTVVPRPPPSTQEVEQTVRQRRNEETAHEALSYDPLANLR
jgi:hypothetical protein